VSLNKEKVSREIRENKIAVCEKTQGLQSGNFSDLNSACSKVLVPVKIFQFHHMHYESERYWDAANGLSVPKTQTTCVKILKQLFASGAVIIGEYSPRLRFRTNYRMDFIYIKEYTNEDEFSKE
jgi:hypothetical protein